MSSERLQAEAWVGDAVLCLFGRLRILRRQGRVDGPQYQRMASNQFLSAFGDPTAVEAELPVIATKLLAGRTIVHVYAEDAPDSGFEQVEPDLKDVYFSVMGGHFGPRARASDIVEVGT